MPVVRLEPATSLRSNSTREKKMTAPQKYSVLEEKDRKENAAREEEKPKSIYEKIDSAVLDLQIDLNSLEFISELLLGNEEKVASVGIGGVLQDYTKLLNERLGLVEELVCSIRRLENEACI